MMIARRICRAAVLAGALAIWSTAAVSQEMPTNRAGFYRAGEVFAHCSAHFAFGAKVARDNNLPDNALAFEGMERGWRVAGLLLLTEGLDPTRQGEAVELFDTLQAVKIDQIKAMRELDPAGYSGATLAEYQAQCAPWSELQKSIIAVMRGGPAPQ